MSAQDFTEEQRRYLVIASGTSDRPGALVQIKAQ